MGKTLGLRPADVNHLIYKAFAGTVTGEMAVGRVRSGPAGGRMGVNEVMGVYYEIGRASCRERV